MKATQEQYMFDAKGKKTGVILSLERYEQLMEDLHDLAVVAERRGEEPIAFADIHFLHSAASARAQNEEVENASCSN